MQLTISIYFPFWYLESIENAKSYLSPLYLIIDLYLNISKVYLFAFPHGNTNKYTFAEINTLQLLLQLKVLNLSLN